ncbi:MAG: MBL fold metallo-hydrolase [Chloroflexi bacterium]|nr:MBL fold metallo-hydrolase [Chloroflexota bacterium]
MTTIAQVTDGIYRIDVGPVKAAKTNDHLQYSLVYFIVSDGETAIVDAGPAVVSPAVLEAIRGLGYDPARLSNIILTHIHLDHAGGAGTLAQQLPKAKAIVHQRGASHIINPDKLIEGTRQAYGQKFEADYGPILPVPEKQVRAVADGDIVRLGRRELKIIYTPGHAPHHVSVYDPQSQGIFSGDSLGFLNTGNNAVIIVPGFNLDYALESIDRIAALNPKHVFAAHGTADREPGEFIQSVRNTTKDYGDIILEATKAGETEEKMAERLLKYHQERNPDDPRTTLHRFDDIIPPYVAFFKRKGVA